MERTIPYNGEKALDLAAALAGHKFSNTRATQRTGQAKEFVTEELVVHSPRGVKVLVPHRGGFRQVGQVPMPAEP